MCCCVIYLIWSLAEDEDKAELSRKWLYKCFNTSRSSALSTVPSKEIGIYFQTTEGLKTWSNVGMLTNGWSMTSLKKGVEQCAKWLKKFYSEWLKKSGTNITWVRVFFQVEMIQVFHILLMGLKLKTGRAATFGRSLALLANINYSAILT